VRITVTAEDVARGQRNQCTRCPIARAIVRCVPGAHLAIVNMNEVLVYRHDEEVPDVCLTPDAAGTFVHLFDLGLPVRPFAFDLPLREDAPCAST
jgi:hypothetical protein